MSVYKHSRSSYWQIEFHVDGRPIRGSSKTSNRKEALAIERQWREQAIADAKQIKSTGKEPMTVEIAFGRYWSEVGQHHTCAVDTHRDLTRLMQFFGKAKRLDQITDADIAALVAWRRGHTIAGKTTDADGKPMRLVSLSTVNRTTVGPLKAIFRRAVKVWRVSLPLEPNWTEHRQKEPPERVRELHDHELVALDAAIRDDFAPWIEFVHLSGLRKSETLLRWSSVNWSTGQIRTMGKGGRWVTTPITGSVKAILEPLKGHNADYVFTYVATATRNGRIKGQRYPITYEGSKGQWRRDKKKSGVQDLKFHDLRHDAATKMLRATGNLKIVQKLLNHSSITTTARYAHVADSDVAEAMEKVATSRTLSRTGTSEAA